MADYFVKDLAPVASDSSDHKLRFRCGRSCCMAACFARGTLQQEYKSHPNGTCVVDLRSAVGLHVVVC